MIRLTLENDKTSTEGGSVRDVLGVRIGGVFSYWFLVFSDPTWKR